MALTKRGKRGTWHYDFILRGRRYQGSTFQTNINKARQVEAKIRSDAALGLFDIGPKKYCPTLQEFLEGQFEKHVTLNAKAKRTAAFYREKAKRLLAFNDLATARLDGIDGELLDRYKAQRLRSVSVITVNGELATLRKALHLAAEWTLITKCPKVRLLPNEARREFVVSGELERAYLAAAAYPLREAAILILDLGLRPEECVRLRKQDIAGTTATVRDGKSKNAARALPLTERALASIELLKALWPDSEWLFPGRKGQHLGRGSLDNLHTRLRSAHDWPKEFVLYSLRHSFGTRLAESGASVFDIKRLMGHSSVKVSERYVHPTADGIDLAMRRKEVLDKIVRGEITPADATNEVRK